MQKTVNLSNPKARFPSGDAKRSQLLDQQLEETRLTTFIRELLTNSGHFLILNALAEIARMGWENYLYEPAHYIIFLAMLVQAAYLSRPNAHRFWGNLLGASLYTTVDLPLDGWEFWSEPNHYILGGFALTIALLQGTRYHWLPRLKNGLIFLESLTRMAVLLALYQVLTLESRNVPPFNREQLQTLWSQPSYTFLLSGLLVVGGLLGLQTLQVKRQQENLQQKARQLGHLAEWGMGSYAVTAAVTNPDALSFQRCDRTLLFMDIRGFTQWCEQTSPHEVAQLLNTYYQQIEPVAAQYNPLRITLTADEIMAIYSHPEQAIQAAYAMQQAVTPLLQPYGLGAGCGIHGGSVIEGLFGSEDVRTYTAIGDVVNVAKRLESATPAGQITLSDVVYQQVAPSVTVHPRPPIEAKGKRHPLKAWYLDIRDEYMANQESAYKMKSN